MTTTSAAQTLHDKSLRSYLLTKYIPAANTCKKAIAALTQEDSVHLRLSVWSLYLNIVSTLLVGSVSLPQPKVLGIQQAKSNKEICRSIWNKVVNEGHQGRIELIDAQLVSACLILSCKLKEFDIGREIAELWFASLPDAVLDDISQGKNEGYFTIVELYTVRILSGGMNDFESANTFLEYNSVLNESKKKELQSLVQEQQELLEKEVIQREKMEEAAKLVLEKKKTEEEAKRLEKERKEEIERLQLLEKQEAAAAAAAANAELTKKNMAVEIREDRNTVIAVPPKLSALDQNISVVKNWVGQITAKGAASYATILIVVFALLALLRGQRGRLSVALQTMLNKLWQTVKMGTKVTYM